MRPGGFEPPTRGLEVRRSIYENAGQPHVKAKSWWGRCDFLIREFASRVVSLDNERLASSLHAWNSKPIVRDA